MSQTLYQTDTTTVPFPNNTNGNSTASVATTSANLLLSFNAGNLGSGSQPIVLASGTFATVFWETPAGALRGWACNSGTWTARLQTNANPNMAFVSLYISRLDSGGNLIATLGSAASAGPLTGGILSLDVTVAAVLPAFNDGDILVFVWNIFYNGAGGNTAIVFDNQTVTTTLFQPGLILLDDDAVLCEVIDSW